MLYESLMNKKTQIDNISSIVIGGILTFFCYYFANLITSTNYQPSWLEIFAVFFNFVCVWLAVKENPWSWIHGAIGATLFGILFLQLNLISSATLNLIYFLPLQFIGLYFWIYGGKNKTELKITHSSNITNIFAISAMLIFVGLWSYFISTYTSAVYVIWDSLILSMSIIAQYYLARKYVSAWYIWTAVNLLSVPLYWTTDAKVVAVQYFVFLCHAIWGSIRWNKRVNQYEN